MPLDLPPKLELLHAALDGHGEVDILSLHAYVIGGRTPPRRTAQQHLGPYVTDLNRRLKGHRKIVQPGRLKGTYALISL